MRLLRWHEAIMRDRYPEFNSVSSACRAFEAL